MKHQLKTIGLMLLVLIIAYVIIQALATWAGLEASKVDDYQILVRLTPTVLEAR